MRWRAQRRPARKLLLACVWLLLATAAAATECPPSNGCTPPGGCPDTWAKAEASNDAPKVELDVTANFLMVYIGWPGSVVLCSAVALAALRNKEDRGVPLATRAMSIRFLNQIIMGYLVFQASAALFFVSLGIQHENLNEAFDLSSRSANSAFAASRDNVASVRDALFEAVAAASHLGVNEYLTQFVQMHQDMTLFVKGGLSIDRDADRLTAVSHQVQVITGNERLQRMLFMLSLETAVESTYVPSVHDQCTRQQVQPCGDDSAGYVAGTLTSFVNRIWAEKVSYFSFAASRGLHTDAVGIGWNGSGPDWTGAGERYGTADTYVLLPPATVTSAIDVEVRTGCSAIRPCCSSDAYASVRFSDQYQGPDAGSFFSTSAACGQCPCNLSSSCVLDSMSFMGCHRQTPFVFRTANTSVPYWRDAWVSYLLPSRLIIDLVSAVPVATPGLLGSVVSTLDLGQLDGVLRGLVTYEGQIIYMVGAEKSERLAGLLLASTQRNSTDNPLVHAVNASHPVVRLSARTLLNSSAGAAGNMVVTFIDDSDTPYLHMGSEIEHLGSFQAVIVDVIPYYSVYRRVVDGNLELICNISNTVDDANQNIAEGMQSMIITSVTCIVLSSALVFLVNKAIVAPLRLLVHDMQEVSQLRLAKILKRYSEEKRSRLHEIHRMQDYFITMVRQLSEMRAYVPEAVLLRSAAVGAAELDDSSDDDFVSLRTVKVSITYISRKVAKNLKQDFALEANVHGIPDAAKKRAVTFLHTFQEGRPSLVALLRECREHLGEKPLEPLRVSALVPVDGKMERINLQDNRHLAGCLSGAGEHMDLIAYKASRPDFIPVLVAIVTVSDVISSALFGASLMSESPPASAGFFALLVLGMSFNLHFAFELNKKMAANELVKEWMEVSQIETTICLCLSAINIQNLQLLHSGIRVFRFVRFHAPVPRKMRHQIIKFSSVSLVGMDIIPAVATIIIISQQGGESLVGMVSIGVGVVSMFCSCIKKLVVFCFVDPSSNKLDPDSGQKTLQQERNVLKPRVITVVHAELTGFDQTGMTAADGRRVGCLLSEWYESCFRAIRASQGTVTSFAAGRVVATFNAPQPLAKHAVLGVTAAWDCTQWRPKETQEQLRVHCGVVTATCLVGGCGAANRSAFHLIGGADLDALALCRKAREIGGSVVLDPECYKDISAAPSAPRDLQMRRLTAVSSDSGRSISDAVEAFMPGDSSPAGSPAGPLEGVGEFVEVREVPPLPTPTSPMPRPPPRKQVSDDAHADAVPQPTPEQDTAIPRSLVPPVDSPLVRRRSEKRRSHNFGRGSRTELLSPRAATPRGGGLPSWGSAGTFRPSSEALTTPPSGPLPAGAQTQGRRSMSRGIDVTSPRPRSSRGPVPPTRDGHTMAPPGRRGRGMASRTPLPNPPSPVAFKPLHPPATRYSYSNISSGGSVVEQTDSFLSREEVLEAAINALQ
eukprot:TRINITY_DN28596_c0_g1_i1.p1 TRINITY_DN28596_c0_g1~~TRINITY_DN28596_c0_g1_i1.p1  ORF type:complete len:1470 (+),score=349.65 TRINITY_DN28596_c0_g1_i1:62-4411(+)